MLVVHVIVETVADYLARREPHRQAHLERLADLRSRGVVVGGGPAPDGRTAELFYRLARPDQLAPLIEEDPYYRGGGWVGYRARSFAQFVEPWERPPLIIDGSRRVTVAEGEAQDSAMAELALVELRGAGRLVFGGILDSGHTVVVLRSADAAEAAGWLAETGFWPAADLTTRPLLHVL